jgi:hypothetical protein
MSLSRLFLILYAPWAASKVAKNDPLNDSEVL